MPWKTKTSSLTRSCSEGAGSEGLTTGTGVEEDPESVSTEYRELGRDLGFGGSGGWKGWLVECEREGWEERGALKVEDPRPLEERDAV